MQIICATQSYVQVTRVKEKSGGIFTAQAHFVRVTELIVSLINVHLFRVLTNRNYLIR